MSETLVNRAQKLRTSKIDPSVDNMLKITGDGRKAALDMRLVDPSPEPADTKVNRAIEKIYSTWDDRQGQTLDAACLLRPLDAQSRPLQRL